MLAPSKATPRGLVPTAKLVVVLAPYHLSSASCCGLCAWLAAAGVCADAGAIERTRSISRRKIPERKTGLVHFMIKKPLLKTERLLAELGGRAIEPRMVSCESRERQDQLAQTYAILTRIGRRVNKNPGNIRCCYESRTTEATHIANSCAVGGEKLSSLARGAHSEVAQGEFQAAVLGMIVVSDGERDVNGVAGEKRRLLQALGHVQAQGVKHDGVSPRASSQVSVLSFQFFGGRHLFAAPDRGSIGMAVRSDQGCDRRASLRRFLGRTFVH